MFNNLKSINMKTISNIQMSYEAPKVEVIEVQVEQGFAATGTGEDGAWS
jgi:hypothetical protein